jgi:hypothetical protein
MLDADTPYLILNSADEKNREGATIPLRADLAADLREWLADKATASQEAVQRVPTVRFDSKTPETRETQPERFCEARGAILSADDYSTDIASRYSCVHRAKGLGKNP